MQEIFKDVKGYEGLYQVSNLGRVKSLERVRTNGRGEYVHPEKILVASNRSNYLSVSLSKNANVKAKLVHQLVAIAFLNHVPNGHRLVVNHINFDKFDNRSTNLEVITARQNTNRKHLKSSSKYTGVCWAKDRQKWRASINVSGKRINLGTFINEYDAHITYEKTLNGL